MFVSVGLLLVRRCGLPRLRIRIKDSAFSVSDFMVQVVSAFYRLAVALIAVSGFQTYSQVAKIVSEAANALAALHRDVYSNP